jgi:alpha-glucosidase (family GH31 glycosyl hydrolase)
VKSDSTYPAPEVGVVTGRDEIAFSTSAVVVRVATKGEALSVSVWAGERKLIGGWTTSKDARVSLIDLSPNERIYGFGDKRVALDQRGQRIEILNHDAYASESNKSYKSIPFYMSSAGYGLFFHNYDRSVFDVGSRGGKLMLRSAGGAMDFYVFVGGFKEVLTQYTELTGRPAMLPRWAFGYHQGKASYDNDEAFAVAREMRRRKLPVDVIYYDDWVDEATTKRFVTSLWNRHRVRLTMGFGMPMFGSFEGVDDSAFLKDLAARHYLMVDRQKRPVIGPDEHVDDGGQNSEVGYLDFFSPLAVNYLFASKWERALKNGLILGMVDFGELDRIQDTQSKFWPSIGLSVARTRNLFSLVYPLSVVSGFTDRTGSRSTGMVRPGFAGTQRLGWTTTGDSYPSYGQFRTHTRAMINLSLSGFSNIGQDLGGWTYKGDDLLYARWFAAGTFFPFMWSHGQGDHEPYSHGPIVERAARAFLNLRYRLVPYMYSLHEAAHRTGIPILRALALQEPMDPAASRIDDQFFIGDNLLVAPIFNDQGDRKLYLPKGKWYDFFGEMQPTRGARTIERRSVPLDRLPVYVRAGAIIPLGPIMQHTSERPIDPLSIHVYGFAEEDLASKTWSSESSLYEDDGVSNDYKAGKYQRTGMNFHHSQGEAVLNVRPLAAQDKFATLPRAYNLHFHGFSSPIAVLLDGQDIPRADAGGRKPSWSVTEATGEILVSIPRDERRSFDVHLKILLNTPPAASR